MAFPSRTSLGTGTTRRCATFRMVRQIDTNICDAFLRHVCLRSMWFNVFPSISPLCPSLCLANVSTEVKVVPSITSESSGLFSVKSELSLKVTKEDKDAEFYCEVNYLVPGGTRMTETDRINITVYCELYAPANCMN